jgi:hypothetical protein
MAARLDAMGWMEEPDGRFAHGFFRRTGEAGSVNRRRRGRLLDGGLRPIPTTRPASWASCHAGLRDPHTGPCRLPRCDASSAPLGRNRSEATL